MHVKFISIFLSIIVKKGFNFLILETHTYNLLYTDGNVSLLISIPVLNFTN